MYYIIALTPVKAVPAMNQAKGSRYQGETLMRYRLADIATMEVTTAPQALMGLSSNTLQGWTSQQGRQGGSIQSAGAAVGIHPVSWLAGGQRVWFGAQCIACGWWDQVLGCAGYG